MGTYYLLLRTWNDINTRYKKKKKRKNEKDKNETKRNEALHGVRSDFLSINSSWFFRAVNLRIYTSSHEKVAREASTHIVAAVER